MIDEQHSDVQDYQDGTVSAYREALGKCQQDIMLAELNLALSDDNESLRNHPGWLKLIDRLQTLHAGGLSKLMRRQADYEQGVVHGQLQVLGAVLSTGPMAPPEIDKLREDLTVLRSRENEYQEILR